MLTTPSVRVKAPVEVQLLARTVNPVALVLLIVTEEKVTVPQVKVESSWLPVPSKVKAKLLGKRLPLLSRFALRFKVVKEEAVRVPPLKVKLPGKAVFSSRSLISQVVVLVMVKLEPVFWV